MGGIGITSLKGKAMRRVLRAKVFKPDFDGKTWVRWTRNRKEFKMPIQAGDSDFVEFFTEGNVFVALAINYSLDYCGIETYCMEEECKVSEIFVAGDEQIKEVLGRKGLTKTEMGVAKGLYQALQQMA